MHSIVKAVRIRKESLEPEKEKKKVQLVKVELKCPGSDGGGGGGWSGYMVLTMPWAYVVVSLSCRYVTKLYLHYLQNLYNS